MSASSSLSTFTRAPGARAPVQANRASSSRRASTSGRYPRVTTMSSSSSSSSSSASSEAEALLVSRLRGVRGRGAGASASDERAIANAITALETMGGLTAPATRDEISGTWRLLYTSKSSFDPRNPLGSRVDGTAPGIEGLFAAIFGDDAGARMASGASAVSAASSSPIQRTVTSLESFTIQQAIRLDGPDPRVDQVVQFGDGNYLRLSAAASVDSNAHDGARIDFAFDLAYFELASGPFGVRLPGTRPVRVPYPVPFRLLGDEARGWLDTTFLGKDVRISRGNKGTTFVLVREAEGGEGVQLPYEF